MRCRYAAGNLIHKLCPPTSIANHKIESVRILLDLICSISDGTDITKVATDEMELHRILFIIICSSIQVDAITLSPLLQSSIKLCSTPRKNEDFLDAVQK